MSRILTVREIRILELLLESNQSFLTSSELAQKLTVSDRTIRSDIAAIAMKVSEDVVRIQAVSGKGYAATIGNMKRLSALLSPPVSEQKKVLRFPNFETIEERQDYILRELLFSKKPIPMDDFLEGLFISEATFHGDLGKIRQRLKNYNLILVNQRRRGFSIEGDEQDKRAAILGELLRSDGSPSMLQLNALFEDISLEQTISVIIQVCRNQKVTYPDYFIHNLALHLILSLKREKLGFNMDIASKKDSAIHATELRIARDIIERLRVITGIQLQEEESYYIANYLMIDSNQPHREELTQQIQQANISLAKELNVAIVNDDILLKGLINHFTTLLYRLKKQQPNTNPLLKDLQANYGEIIRKVKQYYSQIPVLQPYDVTEDEWAYVALHIIAAIEKVRQPVPLKVVLVCSSGKGTAQMLKVQLNNIFGNQLQVMREVSFFELSDPILKDSDLIISTVDMSNLIFSVPVVRVHALLNEEDIHLLHHYIDHHQRKRRLHTEGETHEEGGTLASVLQTFEDYFRPELFMKLPQASTKEAVLDLLIQQIQSQEDSLHSQELLNQIHYRETFGSAAFSPQVALPHPVNAVTIGGYIAVALCPQGIHWSSTHPEIKIVFLMSPSKLTENNTEGIAHTIASIVLDPVEAQRLMDSSDFSQFAQIFKQLIQKYH